MSRKRSYFCCTPKDFGSNSNNDVVVNEPAPTFSVVKSIWQEKMIESQHFLRSEIDEILPIWIKFTRSCIGSLPNADAKKFYTETKQLTAKKIKYFSAHGWECLIMEFLSKSGEDSLRSREAQIRSKDDDISSASSTESTSYIQEQVEFLLQLIASSNFSFNLVKIALDPLFKPTQVKMKYHQAFLLPKKYLELELNELQNGQIQKDLLNGVYDEYILPLQIANEVNDEFWIQMQKETIN